jgi:hypothetical protein
MTWTDTLVAFIFGFVIATVIFYVIPKVRAKALKLK